MSSREKPAVWFSTNGRSWQRVALGRMLDATEWGEITLDGVAVTHDGFMILGGIPAEPANSPMTRPAVWLWSAR